METNSFTALLCWWSVSIKPLASLPIYGGIYIYIDQNMTSPNFSFDILTLLNSIYLRTLETFVAWLCDVGTHLCNRQHAGLLYLLWCLRRQHGLAEGGRARLFLCFVFCRVTWDPGMKRMITSNTKDQGGTMTKPLKSLYFRRLLDKLTGPWRNLA